MISYENFELYLKALSAQWHNNARKKVSRTLKKEHAKFMTQFPRRLEILWDDYVYSYFSKHPSILSFHNYYGKLVVNGQHLNYVENEEIKAFLVEHNLKESDIEELRNAYGLRGWGNFSKLRYQREEYIK